MPSKSCFRANISIGFRTKLYTNIKGFELTRRLVAANDSRPTELEVVFITGNDSTTTHQTIDRFARDFGFSHIYVQEYLRILATKHEEIPEALGPLHPISLKHILAADEKVPAYLLLQILERYIHRHVQAGHTRFLISGLDGDAETAAKFPRKVHCPTILLSPLSCHLLANVEMQIAQLSAVISLVRPREKGEKERRLSELRIEDIRAAIEENYRDILLEVDVTGASTVDEEYSMLLGAIAKRAFES
ncbi:hypothetical protein D0862_07980 [Hortaea werneckii]|uniref:Uncharacterized protein n=1 Tax=Hortaea werneckii TaxID=91943 RepID=A0A3M7GA50_HORWE|nr:hypothetical protein D0862_07980 [Hortaea werneckii]